MSGIGGNFKHGHSPRRGRSPTYTSWAAMCKRCLSPKDKDYSRYGGKGIKICKRWLEFKNFLADMGERPPRTTLDRKNNSAGYNKRNCRWASPEEQVRNRHDNVFICVRGVTKLRRVWAEENNLKVSTITSRIALGWSPENAVTVPARAKTAAKK